MIDFFLIVLLLFLALICVLGISVLLAAFITGVPFVPTHTAAIEKMIELGRLKKGSTVYDLGSGLGHILFATPKEVRRIGYERVIFLVWGSKFRNALKKDSVTFFQQDFFRADLADADVLFCYLFPQIMDRFQKEIWPKLPTGCRVISNGFPMSEVAFNQKEKVGSSTLYLYIKP